MNRIKTNTNLRLMAICLVTFSILGMGCTSLQQSTSIATDDLYTTSNNTIASNKKIISTENWGVPNKAQNYNSNQQNNNNQQVAASDNEEYQDYQNYQDDRYLRLKVANRNRWSSIDDFGYWNDPRFNNAFYPSYTGWNSWYTGYYGASWYNPFGPIYSMGWGGYNPYMSSFGYGMGWGFNDFGYGGFGYGGFGYDGFGYGGFGYGGFGYGGFGYGGWNPYYAGFWNPYHSIYQGGNNNFNRPGFGRNMQQRIATRSMQNSAVTLGAYRNNRGYNNSNANANSAIGNTRALSNPAVNNNFGSLVKRVVTNNANVNNGNGNSGYDRPARYFTNNNNNNSANNSQYRAANSTSSPQQQSTNSINSSGGRSGGFNSTGTSAGSARPGRGQNP